MLFIWLTLGVIGTILFSIALFHEKSRISFQNPLFTCLIGGFILALGPIGLVVSSIIMIITIFGVKKDD